MPFLQLNHAKIYYEDEGVGDETLLFGHSMLFNLRMFDDQVLQLKERYRCIRFDFRGQGKSQITKDGYDLDTLAEDILEFIKKLDLGPCHFIGFSMGGMVAMRLAFRYPEHIKSLILIDTSSEPEPSRNYLRNNAMLLIAQYLGLEILANRVIKMFFSRNFISDPTRKIDHKVWKNHFLSNDKKGIIKVIKGVLSRKEITSHLRSIDLPCLILVGENDHLTDLAKAKIMQQNIRNSELRIIPNSAHMSPVEEPKFVSNAILGFMQNFKNAKSI